MSHYRALSQPPLKSSNQLNHHCGWSIFSNPSFKSYSVAKDKSPLCPTSHLNFYHGWDVFSGTRGRIFFFQISLGWSASLWGLAVGIYLTQLFSCAVVLNRRQKQLQLLRIRQREAKKRQSQAPQEASYRHKPTAVKRCAGDVLAPVSSWKANSFQNILTFIPALASSSLLSPSLAVSFSCNNIFHNTFPSFLP